MGGCRWRAADVAGPIGRWSEVTRRLELWIQILEINENGDFVPVEVVPARDVRTGGIFQLRQVKTDPPSPVAAELTEPARFNCESAALFSLCRLQGQSRRIQVDVRSVQDSGTMPLITEIILAVSVGCVEIRNTAANQEEDEMDSYQVDRPLCFS